MSTAEEKMACAARELVYRRRTYPRLVAQGKMSFPQAQIQIGLMSEIVDDYRALIGAEELPLFIETNKTMQQR
jgi:hypothetical protein